MRNGNCTIQSLWVYPVKSCAGICLDAVKLDRFGIVGDRRWMVVDANGNMITARKLPALLHVRPQLLENQNLMLNAPNMPALTVSPPTDAQRMTVQVWQDKVADVPMHIEGSQWFSDFLNTQVFLVWMDDIRRFADSTYTKRPAPVTFADGFPLLVINQASIEEIGQRLGTALDIRRFRANIVVNGREAWEEDNWHSLQDKSVRLINVKPCARCQLICIDPDSLSNMPTVLKCLSNYRRTKQGIIVGFNAIHIGTGQLKKGQTLLIEPKPLL